MLGKSGCIYDSYARKKWLYLWLICSEKWLYLWLMSSEKVVVCMTHILGKSRCMYDSYARKKTMFVMLTFNISCKMNLPNIRINSQMILTKDCIYPYESYSDCSVSFKPYHIFMKKTSIFRKLLDSALNHVSLLIHYRYFPEIELKIFSTYF